MYHQLTQIPEGRWRIGESLHRRVVLDRALRISAMQERAMKRELPQKHCLRCGKATTRRRGGRPICLTCWVVLAEFESDKQLRRMGKLKGTHGKS
jgi:hypothetical protein